MDVTEPVVSEKPASEAPTARRRLLIENGRLTRTGRLTLIVLSCAVFLTALDQTVVVTALPGMANDVHVPDTQVDRLAWIVSGYLLGYVIAMPLMGRITDVYGRWRVFIGCQALFAVGSLICALSPTLGNPIAPDTTTFGGSVIAPAYSAVHWLLGILGHVGVDTSSPGLDVLVGARFLQAVGGGALIPVAMAVVGDLFGERRRGLALGLVGAVTEAGGVLGPLWGAWITSVWGWTWIFFINIPLVVAISAFGFFCIPRSRGAKEPIDVIGAVLFGLSLAFLTIGLGQQSGQTGTFSVGAHVNSNPLLLIAALVLFALFLLWEWRRRQPVVELAMFRRSAFSAASALSLIIGAALIVALVEIPLFFLSLGSAGVISAGLDLLRMTVFIPVGAFAGGWLSARIGCRVTAVVGLLFTTLGFWLMHLWPADPSFSAVTSATVAAGLGFGLVIAPISTSALNASERRQAGSASSIVTALRMAGMILGLAGLTSWGLARFQSLMFHRLAKISLRDTAGYASALNSSLHQVYVDIFLVTAVIALIGVVPAVLLWRRPAGAIGGDEFESFVAPLA
ncbi:MAG TPA: MFS transporter [Ktedonobacterales bacterium]|nr:MFS transporter [Ktedonobacterales bacterium]